MDSQLSIGNLVTVGDMKFHDIEGGFGKNKRAMLVKEIAEIHNQPLGEINRRINENRKHFIDGKDILDIRANGFEPLGRKLGYSKQSFNQSTNIYVLSERGYSKLLKIMDDDLAWEKYDQLVDGYFQMRQVIKESPEALESAKRIRAEAMLLNAKTRAFKTVKAVKDNAQLSDVAAELYGLSTLENLLDSKLGHAPEVGKLYTASEIANSIRHGCTAQKIGRVAKANNLQTDEFGIWTLDKSPYSAKQVNSFRYNEQGKAKLKSLFGA
jgi:hypothetical protein